jgi:hypothetical protein
MDQEKEIRPDSAAQPGPGQPPQYEQQPQPQYGQQPPQYEQPPPQYEQPQQPQYGQPSYGAQQPQYRPSSFAVGNAAFNGNATGGLVCGILSLVFCWAPVVPVVLGIIAIALRGKGKLSQKVVIANVGFGLGIGGLVVGIIMLIFWIAVGSYGAAFYY